MSVKQASSCCLFLAAAMLVFPASATTIVMPSDAQLVEKSPVVIIGTVVRSDAVERNGGIWTETAIHVERTLKGDAPEIVIIREAGGRIGDRFNVVFGSPEFIASERVLVFLWPTPRGDFQTRDLFVGKFTERRDINGQRIWFRPENTTHTVLLDKAFQPLIPSAHQRDASGFERFIIERVADADTAKGAYLVEAPILTRGLDPGKQVVGNFTMISEPSVYRWFGFDSGSTATWKSLGNQIGYSESGVAELRTAIHVWSQYSLARIRYSYGGPSTGNAGGLAAPNGVNEVIFGDLNNEIDGAWNPSTGGVVGRGGFNGVRAGGDWTSPFAADATHPAATFSVTGNIVEGNLVIQDGVSPAQGISSAGLAEILAHELGHTLGFGHSVDPTALMFARVTGGGASLKADDQLGARWLYPTSGGSGGGGGTTPPTVPAAPSNLTAVVANVTQMQLAWRDNSSNEASQAVYLAAGSAAFVLIGEVVADRTSATLSGLTLGQNYRAYVTARNTAGESSPSNTAQVTIPDGTAVSAAFAVSPATGTAGITSFTFADQSTGPVVSRQWNFGNGQSASTLSVSHVYAIPGSYSVSLTVRNSSNVESTTTRNVLVMAAAPPVRAAFTYAPSEPTVNDTLNFFDQSIDATSWSWNFGDGTGSNFRNPTKRYPVPGRFIATLTSSDGTSSAIASREITVTAGSPAQTPVAAQFEVSNATPVANTTVQFTDRSTGLPNAWLWTFGDGSSSNQQSPSHTYRLAGTFAVNLKVSNLSSTATRTRTVTVAPEIKPFRSLVPVSAQTPGAGDTNWRTELTLFNASEFSVDVRLEYLPDAGPQAFRQTGLGAGQSVTFANALLDVFGLSSGAGAIFVEATNPLATPSLKVASRTFTTSPSGTYGLFVPGEISPSGEPYLYITGLAANTDFRTNIGLVNNSDQPIGISITVFDASGSPLGHSSTNLAPKMFSQTPLITLFPASSFPDGAISLRITASIPSALTAYASVVDNRSQDPTYLPAVPALEAQDLFIPIVGRTAGASGTYWRSDVTLFNPGVESMTVTLRLLESGRDNRGVTGSTLSLPAGKTTVLTDVVEWLGKPSGSGALQLSFEGSSVNPIVTSRTYTSSENGGTYGQAIDPAVTGQFGVDRYVAGLKSDASYRSNLGFVNRGDAPIGVHVTLLAGDGRQVSTAFLELPAKSQSQMAVATLFFQTDVLGLGNFIIRARTISPSSLFTYGSVIDNSTGDPVFIAGE